MQAAATSIDAPVLAAKLQVLGKQWAIIGVVHLLVASITVVMLWGEHPTPRILAWYAAALLLTLVRWRLLHYVRGFSDSAQSHRARAHIYMGIAGTSGILWGMLAVLFLDFENVAQSAFIICLLVGMTAGALPSMAALVPVYYTFATPLIFLLCARLLALTGTELYWLTTLIVAFWGASLLFGRNLQQTITASITADLHNVQLLAEITEAKEEAERANLAKSRFLAAASHDLRQPLYAMGLFLGALRDRVSGDENRQLFDNIEIAHSSLESLFNALLEISKLDSGRVEPQLRHFDLLPMLESLCRELRPEATHKGLQLAVSGPRSHVISDPILLLRIVRNLVSNAIHFTNNGRVDVTVVDNGPTLTIRVEDTGVGIPAHELDNIFSEYHQLHNVERDRSKGLGLGLAVVRRMANLLEHPITVRSTVGQGSQFCVDVPVGDANLSRDTFAPEAAQSMAGKHIVVIDDEQQILDGTRVLLERWGCTVTTASSGSEALAKLANCTTPDLVVSDYRLRENETGINTIRAVRQHYAAHVPALLISGDTDKDLLRAINAQGFHLLHKPVKPPHLRKAMSDLFMRDESNA